jgi:hypothetical protein
MQVQHGLLAHGCFRQLGINARDHDIKLIRLAAARPEGSLQVGCRAKAWCTHFGMYVSCCMSHGLERANDMAKSKANILVSYKQRVD